MANYESKMRTSCFEVENVENFEAEMKKYAFEDFEISKFPEVSDQSIVLLGSDFSDAFYDFDYLESAGLTREERFELEEENVNVFEIIQQHLKPDGVVLINSIGSEKHRYVIGDSVLITKDNMLFLNAEEAIKQLAVDKGLISQEQAVSLHCSN